MNYIYKKTQGAGRVQKNKEKVTEKNDSSSCNNIHPLKTGGPASSKARLNVPSTTAPGATKNASYILEEQQ
jgi:hypothetical protein